MIAILLAPIAAMAQTPVEDRLKAIVQMMATGCSEELDAYCSNVLPGNGRIIACTYGHEDKLSDRCKATFNDARLHLNRV